MTREEMFRAAERAEEEFVSARATWADLVAEEDRLESLRCYAKQDAIRRLMDGGKASSVSAAEKIVETDEAYLEYLTGQRTVVRDKNAHWTRAEAARLRALRLIAALANDPIEITGAPRPVAFSGRSRS